MWARRTIVARGGSVQVGAVNPSMSLKVPVSRVCKEKEGEAISGGRGFDRPMGKSTAGWSSSSPNRPGGSLKNPDSVGMKPRRSERLFQEV